MLRCSAVNPERLLLLYTCTQRFRGLASWVLRAATVPVLIVLSALPARADLLWGANGHPYTAYPGISYEQQMTLLADLGLKSYRVNVSSVGDMGPLIAVAKAHGITILPVLTPALDLARETPEALYKKAYDMAFELVSRHKADIRVWELGNEMENYAIIKPCEMRDDGKQYPCAWGPAGGLGALDYYGPRWAKVSAVLKGLSEGTIAADPAAQKAMGTAGWGHSGAFKRMEQDGIKWDISVWHLYGEDPEPALKEMAKYGKPVWLTEFNHAEGSKKSVEAQAAGLARWIARFRELAPRYRIEAAHIYELLDETYWAPSGEAYMGLLELEKIEGGWRVGRPKPAYEVVKRLVRTSPETTAGINSGPAPGQSAK